MAKRPKKIVYGDQIQRSEYNDGVLRDNNRANNRLSREMLMYEKAQKVILKDLGKETQLLRSKLSMTTITSPRSSVNTTAVIEPFTVYGMSANPKSKKEPVRKVTLKPIYPSFVEQGAATPREQFYTPRTSLVSSKSHVTASPRSRNSIADSRNTNSRNILLNSRNSVLKSRNELVDNSVSPKNGNMESRNNSVRNSRSSLNSSWNSGVQLSALNTSSKTAKSKSSTKFGKTATYHPRSENELSVVETRMAQTGVVSDVKSRQGASRLSFIEILADAEERKAKEAKLELQPSHSGATPYLRPRTPIISLEDDVIFAQDDVFVHDRSRRGSFIGATPLATSVTIPHE